MEETENPNARFFVLLQNGETAGYAGMHCVCGECYIDNIAVRKAFRRRGFGRLLLNRLVRQAREEKASFITLEVRVSNEPARELYEKSGFTERGSRRKYYSDPAEDAVIYTLDLE